MIDVSDFRELIIQPVLKSMGRYSESAENLLVGIALHESRLTWLKQLSGPALGVYQMEPATHKDLWKNSLRFRPEQAERLWYWASSRYWARTAIPGSWTRPDDAELIGNLYYATAAAREQLWRAEPPLPAADDDEGLAQYWHDNWCKGCAGTVEDWLSAYRRYGK